MSDELVKSHKMTFPVIPAKVPRQARDPELVERAGIQGKPELLDPGACPGPDPGSAGVTALMTFYDTVMNR